MGPFLRPNVSTTLTNHDECAIFMWNDILKQTCRKDKDGKNPHWILKNSFGSGWGENGYFRIHRGGNADGVLSLVSYAKPVLGDSNYFNKGGASTSKAPATSSDASSFLEVNEDALGFNDGMGPMAVAWREMQKSISESTALLHQDIDGEDI